MRTRIFLFVAACSTASLAAPEIRVVFPPAGASVTAAGQTHVLGSIKPPDAPVTVNGVTADVWRTGSFVCMVPINPGTNTLVFKSGKTVRRHTFRVPFPAPPWNGRSLRPIEPLQPLGVYTGEAVRLVCDAPAGRAVRAQVGERTVTLAPEPSSPTRYAARVLFPAPAETVPVAFFSEGLPDAPGAAISARAAWPAVRVTGRLFETRARSEPGEGDTAAFLTPGLRLQGAGFVGAHTRVWLEGKPCFVDAGLLAPDASGLPPPPRDAAAPDLCAGFGPRPPANRAPSEILVVLDPGHGGSAAGAIGPGGLCEKTVALQQAKAAQRSLEAAGFRVRLTRESDVNPDLYERARLAYSSRAAAFISIHYNATVASTDPRAVRHIATYHWNALGGSLAQALHPHLARASSIPDGGVRQASFAVCRNPAVPSVLIELDFITVPQAEEAIQTAERQNRVADAIVDGLRDWLRGP